MQEKNNAISKSVGTVMVLRKIKSQTRKIEQIELDYFLRQSGRRLLNVKSGTALHKVIETQRKQNFSQLDLLETAIDSVTDQTKKMTNRNTSLPFAAVNAGRPTTAKIDTHATIARNQDASEHQPLVLTKSRLNVDEYFKAGIFDPRLEINKERNLDDFFKEKYKRVSHYLKRVEQQTNKSPAATTRNFGLGPSIHLGQSVKPKTAMPEKPVV
jgi:hypothetical protein